MIKKKINIKPNIPKLLFLFCLFGLNHYIQAQTNNCITGDCNDNIYVNSSDPNTMEYDNIVGLYHSTLLKETDGTVSVWGAAASPTGDNQLVPIVVSPANGYNYQGKILRMTGGAANLTKAQFAILTTEGLYFWGATGNLVSTSVKSGSGFGKANALRTYGVTGTNPYSLPMGVVPSDVKMMFGTYKTLVIVTCTGEAYVLSQNSYMFGDGISSTSSPNTYIWHKVSTAIGTPLKNIVAVRGSTRALMALTSDGEIYTWGRNIYLGNGSSVISTQGFAVQMTKPSNTPIKQIGVTSGNSSGSSYFVLSSDGKLYSLGNNTDRTLGDFTTNERRGWVRVKKSNASNDYFEDVAWISPNEHSASGSSTAYGAINVLTSDGKLWSWGRNSRSMLGSGSSSLDPTFMSGGLDPSDNIMAVETGGHTTMVIRECSMKYGYLGHRVSGSMGDGTSVSESETNFNFSETADVSLCGAPTGPAIQGNLEICNGETADLENAFTGNTSLDGDLEWFMDAEAKIKVPNPSSVGPGTYYAAYENNVCGVKPTTKVVVRYKAELSVTITIDNNTPKTDDEVEFTITVKNTGGQTSFDTKVGAVIPSGYTFVSADTNGAGSFSNTTGVWTIGDLNEGTVVVLKIKAKVLENGDYNYGVSVESNEVDCDETDNTSEIEVIKLQATLITNPHIYQKIKSK